MAILKNKMANDNLHDMVKDYYGKVLSSKNDLKTSACCDATSFPEYLKKPLSLIHPEIQDKFYGCGSPLPMGLKGCKVLDLGCGTGRDCYLASYLVGEEGEVVGIDMTDEQLAVANKYIDYQTEKFGFKKKNVRFIKGFIEDIALMDLPDNYFDVVISNCVLNLSPAKDKVVEQVYRVLKQGGEFYFSDVYSDRRLPEEFKLDKVLLGECLGGALYWKDFERIAIKNGFLDPRIYANRTLDITNAEIATKIGLATFTSTGYRLFKLDGLEDACEDFGHKIKYLGGLAESPEVFYLDNHHVFKKNRVYSVCGNTYRMLHDTRFKNSFYFKGDFSEHQGPFNCVTPVADDLVNGENCSGPGCC
jgi:SAM-dependent methyltransferase